MIQNAIDGCLTLNAGQHFYLAATVVAERHSLPKHLNGEFGSNRVNDNRCQIAARNDMEANQC